MRAWHILVAKFRSVWLRGRREADLDEELRFHVDRETERLVAAGVAPGEARLQARRAFGAVEVVKEQSRDARGTAAWDLLVGDTRHAARRLARDWRFSLPAVVLLGLGIGANTAIFSVVNATLFRPSPFRDSARLVEIYQNTPEGAPGTNTYPAYQDIASATNVFAQVMTATIPINVRFREGTGAVRAGLAEYATASYPAVLGILPSRGRWFTAEENRPGAPVVAVVGYQTWQTRFDADPGVIGREIFIQGTRTTIVGVGPQGYRSTFDIGMVTDFWLPVESTMGPIASLRVPEGGPFFVKARLREGVTVAQAQAAMDGLGRRLASAYPKQDAGKGISVFATDDVRVHPQMDGLVNALASVALSVVGLVLAVACSNLATLLLVRAAARTKEVSIRLAIGATRWQVVRHLLTESVLLSVAGGAAGCALAWSLLRALRAVELPVTVDFSIDVRVLGFAVVLSVITGVLFGLAPALNAARLDLLSVIREDGLTAMSGRRRFTLRNALVVFQVTASVVLLTAAGAFVQIGVAARNQTRGYAIDGVAWLETDASYSGYTKERAAVAYNELRRRVAALPGVQAAALIQGPPMENATQGIVVDGGASGERKVNAGIRWAAPGFFDVMQVPVVMGRALDDRDRAGGAPVAVIDESMARNYFGDINAIGRRFRFDFVSATPWIEVVGVVRDVSASGSGTVLDPDQQVFFLPVAQTPPPQMFASGATIVARTSGDAAALVRELQRELMAMDSSLPVFAATTMTQRVASSEAGPHSVAMALAVLGGLGLVLAGVGLYAVIAFAVSRRAREIGIRMALGARGSDVARGVARDAAAVLGVGAGVGLAFAVMVIVGLRATNNTSAGIVNINFPPPSVDPLQLAVIVAFILLVGLAAAVAPARRAARMSPLDALRER